MKTYIMRTRDMEYALQATCEETALLDAEDSGHVIISIREVV